MFRAKKLDKNGIMNPLAIPLILSVVVLLVSAGMAVLYYTKFVEQRDNNQPFIEEAVAKAEETQKEKLETEFTEREKIPTKNYTSPSELGGVKLTYPKTWSAYVDMSKTGGMDYFGHPNYVPADNVNYALRMSVVDKPFSNEVKAYDNAVKKGELRATAVRVSGTTGTRLDGFLKKDQEGSMVVFPLRDKTLRVWTESKEFTADFNNIVLKSLTFVP
jgi:hypothetical protein